MSSLNKRFLEYLKKEELNDERLVNENYRLQHSKRRANGKTGMKKMDYGIMKFKWLTVFVKYYLESHGNESKLLKEYGVKYDAFRARYNRWIGEGMPVESQSDRFGNLIPIPGTEDRRGRSESRRTLTYEEEKEVKVEICNMINNGEKVTDSIVRDKVKEKFMNKYKHITRQTLPLVQKRKFSRHYIYLLRLRFELANSIATHVQKEKIEITPEKHCKQKEIDEYKEKIKKFTETHGEEMIMNMDETMIRYINGRDHVWRNKFSPAKIKTHVDDKAGVTVTAVLTITASGHKLSCMVIKKR
jgi:hypothetical protein